MAEVTRTKPIEINALDRFHKSFNPILHEAVRKSLAGPGRVCANLVVHPFFCYQNLKALRFEISSEKRAQLELTHNPTINSEIRQAEATNSQSCYSAYMTRLGKHLRSTLFPIFILAAAPDRLNILHWLNRLQPFKAPLIMLDALGRDATPTFDTVMPDKKAWEHFSDILDDLLIQEIEIAGEKAYGVGIQRLGCVYCVEDNLLARYFSLLINQELIYPNIYLP